MGYRCERCHHIWIPKDLWAEPAACPRCRSSHWNRPRNAAPPLTYENFRDTVRELLETSGPLTWKEIKVRAQLSQVSPSTRWVHRMQGDIGLERKKDPNGLTLWQLRSRVFAASAGDN
jgi:DNA-directed RNA polymerase subunit RPC12/RpoP